MRHTPRYSTVIAALILSSTVACGSNKTTGPSTSGGSSGALGTMTFKVDGGSTIVSTAPTATLTNGILSAGGGVVGTILGFALTPTAAGTGTYTMAATSPTNATLFVGNPAQGWQAGVGFGSGSVTITSLTSTTVAGTFTFSMVAVQGTGASGTKSVTEGVFNLNLTAQTPAPTTPSDSTISATVDGVAWSGSVSRRATLLSNFLTLTGQDTNGRVITFVLPFTSTVLIPPSPQSVYSLNFGSPNQPVVGMNLGAEIWDNSHAGATGSLTITGITQTRVTGTFQVGLIASPLNVPLTNSNITNGKFDMALERF